MLNQKLLPASLGADSDTVEDPLAGLDASFLKSAHSPASNTITAQCADLAREAADGRRSKL